MASYTGSDKRLQYLFLQAGVDNCRVVSGYYHDGSFYEDQSYTQLITGSTDSLYIDLSTTTLYLFNGSTYEEVQGGGGGSTVTITPTLATGTKIADYSIDGTTDSLYAPNGGSSSLDGLTDVTITTPSDGQALLYDSTTGEWVNGTVPGGGGGGSEGTAGLSIDISLGAGQSITYSRTDLNITRKGCYLFSITSGHNAWMEYLGYFFYGGHYPGYTVSGIFSIRSSYLTVSYSDGQNGTFTIKNTSSYAEGQRIEILPIHPKLDVDTNVVSGYYHNGEFYEDQSYTQIITGDTDHIYIDQLTNTLYLYDGTGYVEVKGSSETTSDGTVGVRIEEGWANPLNVTHSFEELGITEHGIYLLGLSCQHAYSGNGPSYLGILFYSGKNVSFVSSYIYPIRSQTSSVTLNESAETITFNGSWGETYTVEVLPLHPKIEIKDERRYFDVQISANSSATYSLEDLKIKEKGAYFVSFVAANAGYANYLGVFMYSGVYNDWQQNNIYSIRNSNCSVSFDNTTGVFTFSNTTSYGALWRIEICPASPNIVETTSGVDSLSELSDVSITTPTDGQALIYDSANDEWVNGTPETGASSLSELSDVSLTTPTEGQALTYDDTNDEWVNTDIPNNVVNGYYHNSNFYEDQSYTQLITGQIGYIYIDLTTTTLYLYDGTGYVEVRSGGSGGEYFICDLLFENTNFTPESGTTSKDRQYTLNNSIDSYDAVLVMAKCIYSQTYPGEQIGTAFIPKSDYYSRALGRTGEYTIIFAFSIDNSVPNNRRSLCFGFASSTTIYTEGLRTESGNEPMLYKVYGLKFGSGAVNDGTIGTKIGIAFDAHESKNYDFSDLNIPSLELGAYMVSVTCNACANCRYIGVLYVSAYSAGSNYIHSLISYQFSVSISNETLTFTSGVSWGDGFSIEILPLHPKIEVVHREVTGTLLSGTTSVTLSDAKITTSSTLEFYTDMFGLSPTNVSVSTGSVTLTFEVQSVDVNVKVRIS